MTLIIRSVRITKLGEKRFNSFYKPLVDLKLGEETFLISHFSITDRLVEEVMKEPYMLHGVAPKLGHHYWKFQVATDDNFGF